MNELIAGTYLNVKSATSRGSRRTSRSRITVASSDPIGQFGPSPQNSSIKRSAESAPRSASAPLSGDRRGEPR